MEQITEAMDGGAGDSLSIADLRMELGLTLAEMGERVGLSKSQMHDVERRNSATVRVALTLEALAANAGLGGRIDAGALCEEVRLSRHGLTDTANSDPTSPGNGGADFPKASAA